MSDFISHPPHNDQTSADLTKPAAYEALDEEMWLINVFTWEILLHVLKERQVTHESVQFTCDDVSFPTWYFSFSFLTCETSNSLIIFHFYREWKYPVKMWKYEKLMLWIHSCSTFKLGFKGQVFPKSKVDEVLSSTKQIWSFTTKHWCNSLLHNWSRRGRDEAMNLK